MTTAIGCSLDAHSVLGDSGSLLVRSFSYMDVMFESNVWQMFSIFDSFHDLFTGHNGMVNEGISIGPHSR